jgi:hypothetical protein
MAEAKVVSNLVHLSTYIVAPLVVVDGQVAVNVCICNPRPGRSWGQAQHHVIKRGGQASKRLSKCSCHCIPDNAIRHSGHCLRDGYLINTICDTSVRSWGKSELVIGTRFVL